MRNLRVKMIMIGDLSSGLPRLLVKAIKAWPLCLQSSLAWKYNIQHYFSLYSESPAQHTFRGLLFSLLLAFQKSPQDPSQ